MSDEERWEYDDIRTDEHLLETYERRQNEKHLHNIRKHGPIISTQTLRLEDLVPTFLDALKVIDRNLYNEYVETALGDACTVEDVHDGNSHIYSTRPAQGADGRLAAPQEPLAYCLLDELRMALESVCPPGVRFGANPGNASDIGFWPAPCENHQDEEWPISECEACQRNVRALHGFDGDEVTNG
jgi:hypothetical protein